MAPTATIHWYPRINRGALHRLRPPPALCSENRIPWLLARSEKSLAQAILLDLSKEGFIGSVLAVCWQFTKNKRKLITRGAAGFAVLKMIDQQLLFIW